MNLEKIKAFAQAIIGDDTTGHDWRHALRVEANAKKISPKKLSADAIEVIRAACWLHDTIDEKIDPNKRASLIEVETVLRENGASDEQTEEVLYIIQNLSYSKNIDKKQSLSFLGQIVQDADRLDALGAIGTARAFYYGGSKKHLTYDDTRPRQAEDITEENYREQNSVVNHFYEKLLRLKDSMNTEKGRQLAEHRTEFMKQFLEELFGEIQTVDED